MGLVHVARLHSTGFDLMPENTETKYHFGCLSLSPIKKTDLEFGSIAGKRNIKATEAGRLFGGLKMGSLCHVVGTGASSEEFRHHTYYYTFLETKQTLCNELPPNGTSNAIISRQLSGDTESRAVVSESVRYS